MRRCLSSPVGANGEDAQRIHRLSTFCYNVSNMIILGIILGLLGLTLFITGGVLSNDSPGIEPKHLALMLVGVVLILTGGIMVTAVVMNMK